MMNYERLPSPSTDAHTSSWLRQGTDCELAVLRYHDIVHLPGKEDDHKNIRITSTNDDLTELCSYTIHHPRTPTQPMTISIPGVPRTYACPNIPTSSDNEALPQGEMIPVTIPMLEPFSPAPSTSYPPSSFQPDPITTLLRALSLTSPALNLHTTALITDRLVLLRLFALSKHACPRPRIPFLEQMINPDNAALQPWRMDVLLVKGKTLVLTRRECGEEGASGDGYEVVEKYAGGSQRET
jgi:hypothetical protein